MVDRAYISASNKANIICKRYERKKTVDVSKFVGTGRTVKINCTCSYGHKLTSISDKVDLPGIYEHLIDKTVIAKAGVSLSAE